MAPLSLQSDSGGPLVAVRPDGSWLLLGLTSWGRGCGRPKYPGVFVHVPSKCQRRPLSVALPVILLITEKPIHMDIHL